MPNGKPIGQRGNRSDIRVIKGGKKEADKLYNKLTKNGRDETPKNYPGKGKRLPNGNWVGYRPKSRSGDIAIDLDIDGIDSDKIHFPD